MQIVFNENDMALLIKAIDFSAEKHRDQRRKDKEARPYINHELRTLYILWVIGNVRNIHVLVASVLHDVIEDTDTKAEEILELFGQEVLTYVLEVSDDKNLPYNVRKQLQIDNASHKSTGAKLIKIADKIHNVESDPDCPKERIVEYLNWTEKVMQGLRDTNIELEKYYDEALVKARSRL